MPQIKVWYFINLNDDTLMQEKPLVISTNNRKVQAILLPFLVPKILFGYSFKLVGIASRFAEQSVKAFPNGVWERWKTEFGNDGCLHAFQP
jgi:hypothetical protein